MMTELPKAKVRRVFLVSLTCPSCGSELRAHSYRYLWDSYDWDEAVDRNDPLHCSICGKECTLPEKPHYPKEPGQ